MTLFRDKGMRCPSQDLETGWPKLATANFWGVLVFKGTAIYSDNNHKHVFFIYGNKA